MKCLLREFSEKTVFGVYKNQVLLQFCFEVIEV